MQYLYWPKAGQYGSFPHVFGSNLCPLSPILELVYSLWCGSTSLHCSHLCQLSVKEWAWKLWWKNTPLKPCSPACFTMLHKSVIIGVNVMLSSMFPFCNLWQLILLKTTRLQWNPQGLHPLCPITGCPGLFLIGVLKMI